MKFYCALMMGMLVVEAAFGEPRIETLPPGLSGRTISLNQKYLVYRDAKKSEQGELPLVIYLHGAGGVGTDLKKVKRQPLRLLETIQKAGKSCLCVAPQATRSPHEFGEKGGWVPADLETLIKHLKETYQIDRKRIYLTGNSMGGYGTFAWAGKYPGHFAAIAPMVGGIGPGGPKDISKELDLWGRNLATIPMKAYYGGKDRVVPADRGAMILKAVKKAGGTKAEVIVLPEEGHGAGRVPFGDLEFVAWLFSNRKEST